MVEMEPSDIQKVPVKDFSYNIVMTDKNYNSIAKGRFASSFKDISDDAIANEFKILGIICRTDDHNQNLFVIEDQKLSKVLNRYADILPYEHTMVTRNAVDKLNLEQTYINANYIDENFIASQGPVESTILHFWQMVWEQNSSLILMLTKTIELKRRKCEQYWPLAEKSGMEYGDYKILNNKVESSPGIEKTTLELIKKGEDEKRIITHILYSGWPDHGAPKEEGMEFIDQILLFIKVSLKTNPTGKIITHCSAGVGRTGTILAIYNIITQAQKQIDSGVKGPILSVFETIRRLREQRTYLCQQPVFLT